MKSKLFLGILLLTAVAGLITIMLIGNRGADPSQASSIQAHSGHKLSVYKSPTCGCCENWTNYMKRQGYEIEVFDVEDMESIKEHYNIPQELFSCHTTIASTEGRNYFIEGHIPEESINHMLESAPDIHGIGMPGMPAGSPGMPGAKTNPFEIMQLDTYQELSLFEEI